MRICPHKSSRRSTSVLVPILLVSLLIPRSFFAQDARLQEQSPDQQTRAANPSAEIFRLERVPVAGGAELITIQARLDGIQAPGKSSWVPLVSVLRDTLGDLTPENDRLRYVWPLTYTRPTMRQRLLGAVPFLYSRVGNMNSASEKAPPAVLDLAAPSGTSGTKYFGRRYRVCCSIPTAHPSRL